MIPDKIDTGCTSTGLLTATGAETVYDTTLGIYYSIDGIAYLKGTVADGTTPTTDGDGEAFETLSASEGCCMVWCLNSSGTVGVFQGPVVDLNSAGDFEVAPDFPYVDLATWAPFAYQILKADSTAGTITFGSSDWNATGFTNSIKNVHTLPARPKES